MKRTVKQILGAAVALAITASGAFATPNTTNITVLPAVIDQPGNYQVHFNNGNAGVVTYGDPALIWIKASGVNLNLSGLVLHTAGNGILIGPKPGDVGPAVDHVAVTNGTIDGKTPGNYFGFVIGVNSTNVKLDGVSFIGTFGYNADYGSSSIVSNGTVLGVFTIISQTYLPTLPATLDPNFLKGGYGTYSNLVVSDSLTSSWTGTALVVGLVGQPGGLNPNAFSNITAVRGDVSILANDTYSNINTASGYHFLLGGVSQN